VNTPTIVYLVIRHRAIGSSSFEVQGIFTQETDACAACKTWDDTYMPIELNKEYPQEWTNCCDIFHPASRQVLRIGEMKWTGY